MALNRIIMATNEAYRDDLILAAYLEQQKKRPNPSKVGDGLAYFLAAELQETNDPKATVAQQLSEAVRAVERAEEELYSVKQALFQELVFESEKTKGGI